MQSLFATKLYVPPSHQPLVVRSRLTTLLSNSLTSGFTLVSAPAGYGKTTLVSSWLRERGLPCAWLSLEESDNDPVRFLQYLLTSLQQVVPGIHAGWLDFSEGVQPASFQALMGMVLNAISRNEGKFVLVLDDFHLVQDQAVLDIVLCMLEHLPTEQMHLVLISRTDPPLPLPRLRLRNQMCEVRAEQLRFMPGEVAEFLNGVIGLNLSADDISAMEARTEGWIAGLQLAALSMQGCKDVHGFIEAFSGSHYYIVDYLADEVLKRMDEEVRSFLLQTSILTRMCASLCTAVVEADPAHPLDSQRMLETLERMNLFIIPQDGERRWYRYHHLFADALNRRLESQFPDMLAGLYQSASLWQEAHGLIAEAIQSALSSGDQERAAQLVEQNGCLLLMSGEVWTLIKWMEAVEQYFRTRPWLLIQKGWALTIARRMEQAEGSFQAAEGLVSTLEPGPETDTMVGTISAGRAFWINLQGDFSLASRLARQALDLLPDTDLLSQSMRSVANGILARTLWMSGDIQQAKAIYLQAAEIGQAAGNDEMVINNNEDIAAILLEEGQLRAAAQLLSETLQMAVRPDGQRSPLSAQIYFGLSLVHYEWNQLDQAEQFAQQCLAVSQQWGNVELQAMVGVMLARLEQARGNLEQAQALIRTAEQKNRDNQLSPWNAAWVEAAVSRFWSSQGSLESTFQRVETGDSTPVGKITYLQELEYLTLLRRQIACADYEPALELTECLLQAARASGRMARVIELLVLQSLAYQGMKETAAAVKVMGEAVMRAQPEGYIRVFLDEGPLVAKLLYPVRGNQTSGRYGGNYATEILDAFGLASRSAPPPDQLLIEPLSGREIEVLKLIEAGLSNQEIATKLFISIATVKRHISNIYAKLGVTSRTQAVARGKELGFYA